MRTRHTAGASLRGYSGTRTPAALISAKAKLTRPGHIVADADVRRPVWLDRIEQAVTAAPVCVFRASSGQGKSALLYPVRIRDVAARGVFQLRGAQSTEGGLRGPRRPPPKGLLRYPVAAADRRVARVFGSGTSSSRNAPRWE